MPSFDARRRELREALTKIQPDLDGAEYIRITAVMEDYFNARDAVLTMMQVVLAEDDPEPVLADYAGRFRDMTRSATDKLDNMLSGLSNPSRAAADWHERVSFAEFIFWGQVGALKIAEARDAMARDAKRVRDLIAALDLKWRNLSDEDLRVEEAEQRAAQDVKDLLETALAQATPYWLQAGTAIVTVRDTWKSIFSTITDHVKETLVSAGAPRALVEALLKLAGWANDYADILEWPAKYGLAGAQEAMDWINRIRSMNVGGLVQYRLTQVADLDSKTKAVISFMDLGAKAFSPWIQGAYDAKMAAFKAQLDNEGVLIVAYGGIRNQVDQFLKDCNLDGLRATLAAALTAMDGLSSALATDGQKSDWSDVKKSIRDALDARRAAAESAFGDFYRANDGRFLGGLSTDTERTLLEQDKWTVTTNGLLAVGVDEKLRAWRQGVTVIQATAKDAYDQVQDAFLGLPLDIRDQVQRAMNDYLGKQITDLNAEADQAIATLESCKLMVNAQKISSDMDRGRLSQALRATIR
jgi:hypothetical protein